MYRLLIFLSLLIFSDHCYSQDYKVIPLSEMKHLQTKYPYDGYKPSKDVAGYCLLDKPRKLDISNLRIIYDVDILVDTLSDKRLKDCMATLIGQKYYKSYGRCCWQICMNHTDRTLRRKDYPWMAHYDGVILNMAIYRNRTTHRITHRGLFPMIDNIVFQYTEPEPRFDWKLSDRVRVIEGYTCHEASCRYAGREWQVWFTTEISVDCGLWKFNGLPGLILEAKDSQAHYHFSVRAIENHTEDIVMYKTPTKIFTRQEFMKRERIVYSAPLFHAFGPDSYFIKYHQNGAKEFVTDKDYVDLPYNPIELE